MRRPAAPESGRGPAGAGAGAARGGDPGRRVDKAGGAAARRSGGCVWARRGWWAGARSFFRGLVPEAETLPSSLSVPNAGASWQERRGRWARHRRREVSLRELKLCGRGGTVRPRAGAAAAPEGALAAPSRPDPLRPGRGRVRSSCEGQESPGLRLTDLLLLRFFSSAKTTSRQVAARSFRQWLRGWCRRGDRWETAGVQSGFWSLRRRYSGKRRGLLGEPFALHRTDRDFGDVALSPLPALAKGALPALKGCRTDLVVVKLGSERRQVRA